MDVVVYMVARVFIGMVRLLPLKVVALTGRICGGLTYLVDRRHRRVALENLAQCFGQKMSSQEIRRLACENFKRIGENFACILKTSGMSDEEIKPILGVKGVEKIPSPDPGQENRSMVFAIGHFGNFELYARFRLFLPTYQGATTYRGLNQPVLNRVLQELRNKSGCWYFDRRSDARALRDAMMNKHLVLGLLVDQHGGDRGLPVPFLGRNSSTSPSAALYALRYRTPLMTAVCFRTGLARWTIEIGDPIPTHVEGAPRRIEDICMDINRAFETAILRDPANWFWVHRRWKHVQRKSRPVREVTPRKA